MSSAAFSRAARFSSSSPTLGLVRAPTIAPSALTAFSLTTFPFLGTSHSPSTMGRNQLRQCGRRLCG